LFFGFMDFEYEFTTIISFFYFANFVVANNLFSK
jgi:hypothetical protein